MAKFVARDDIWKIHISREKYRLKSWKQKVGILTSEYQEMFDNSKTMRRDAKEKTEDVVFPPKEDGKPLVQSGPKIIPKTTAQFVGWKVGTEQSLLIQPWECCK